MFSTMNGTTDLKFWTSYKDNKSVRIETNRDWDFDIELNDGKRITGIIHISLIELALLKDVISRIPMIEESEQAEKDMSDKMSLNKEELKMIRDLRDEKKKK